MADTTGRDDIFDEPESDEADDFFSGGQREAGTRRGESLDEILRDGAANDRRDESISNIHTGSKTEHVSVLETAPPEGAPPPPTPIIEPGQYDPGDPPPPIDPIDVDQQAGGTYQAEERGLDFEFSEGQFAEDRVFEDLRRPDDEEDVRRDGEREQDETEELILTPTTDDDDDEPTVPSEVDDNPETPFARSAVLDEDDLAGGSDGAGPRAITQPLIIDFGDDGAGDVRLTVPDSLRQIQAGPENTVLDVELSADGRTITAVDTGGDPVFKVTLNSSGGGYSYTFELQGTVHHGEVDQIDFPIGIAVTDSDGDLAVGQFNVGIVDDAPVARDDDTVQLDEGADKNTIGSDNGADNLLANDEQGADGALIFQFTYTDENGEEQTARAGETVDTEHGTLTVNADGSWSFEADEQIDHEGGEIVADNFTYSIVDADGDTSSATQSIEITDDGPQIGFPPGDDDPDGAGDLATLFEDDIAGGGASVTQTLEIDFGTDGEGSVVLSIPGELEDMGLTAGGKPVEFALSDDGQSIVATAGGDPVFTMSLSQEDGEYSYTFELQGNLDHPDAGSDVLSNLPFDLTVTDGDGSTASAEININVVDDQPEAVGEATLKMEEGGGTIGSGNGGANLLANDDVGADGGEVTSFTYTDEAGNEQTADAGQTVDTEHGSLTVNADGSWSFESDPNADHGDGETVSDGFTYTVTDGDGDTSQATQRIEITDQGPEIPPNDPPTGNPPGAGDQPDLGRADLVVDEDSMGSASQAIEVDFGQDGFGSASLSVPQELEDMGLTSGGETISYAISDDGQSITASTLDGSPVFTVTLDANAETGELSYTVDLQGNVDHAETGAGDDLLSNLPVTLTVTDGDGTEASTNLEIGIKDDSPEASNDAAVTLEEGGSTVGSGNGGANLLANDDVGADGAQVTSFTYTDEAGNEQSAEAGQTVDTEHGSLTVNADGSWSFESDPNADHSDGAVSDGFTYTITDGDGDTATASQSITVTDTGPEIPPNDPPTGNPPGAGDQPDLGRADLVVDEDSMGSASQAIEVDFGQDGFGSASLSVPQELEDMGLTSGGETISYAISDDGQSITASTLDGSPVFTVTLDANAETGELSYTVDLQGNVDHAETGAGDDLLSNLPVTLTVTDGDGTEASTNLEIGIKDDSPEASNDAAVTLEEGGSTVGSGNGGANLLANDDVGADGAQVTSFTYTDEAGNEQSAEAGQTVDTEHGSLTVNADGSWSFESDPNADHSDGAVSDGFTYTITDGDGDTATASQSITVTDTGPEIPPNDPPTGNPPGAGDQPDLGRADLVVDEDSMGSASQAIEVDFGQDGFGSASLSVPQELEDMGLTSGGETISYAISDDGQSITASTLDGSPVFTVTLDANAETGELSYTVDLQGNVDHAETGAGDDLLSNLPVTLTVTDGDGTEASTNLEIGIKDDSPMAVDDATVTVGEDGQSLSVDAEDGLLSNDDVGADGGEITSFTYTDEAGNEQTAEVGQTVDTENGQLTVNADGSWSFESDPNADHSDGAVSDGFTYTITDGDGDTATATQDITITDEGPKIGPPPGTGGGEPGADGYSVTLDEGDLGTGAATAGGQALNIDFGADGEGAVALSVPQELEDMGLTAGGEAVTFTVSDDGQSITGSTPDGSPVMTITLNEDGGNYSYSVELSDNLDHTGANGETISDIPVTLTVTDGDGDTASTSLNVNVVDDAPEAVDDGTFNVTDGGNTIGTDGGQDNLLGNDDPGADGAQVTSFTYTDENGENRTAQAGETVDTQQGTLTVNADGTWSFESDEQMESADGQPVMDNFTYTITDGDGDTSTATVGINVSDGTAEPPELVVGDAEGYEDNAIPLNISSSLTDTDGSERLSVTISGVPNGASLSAGTDNGDGTWSLEEGDLDGLTVTPPTDSDVDFDLSVSVTSTETATGETTTVTDTFTVEVDAVADPTTVSATVEARLVEGEPVTETVTGEGSIDASNFNQEGQGFSVSARTLNADGSLSDASTDNVTSQGNGLGVKGSASDGEPDAQLGFNPETETSEQLVIDFDHDVTELNFTVSRLFADEGDGRGDAAGDEQGKWQVYDDGELVAEGTFSNESGNEGTFSIDLPDGVSFNQIVFSGTEYSGGDGDQIQDSSDYFIKEIDFSYEDTVVVEEAEPHCEVTVNVDATFGDFTDGSENHFVVVEVPEGWEAQGEYVEVDSSNYGEGNFIAIPVDADDLQASGGSISVPVTFNAPAPDADESVDLDVFAVAQEVNIDGTVGDGEITLDNNNTMSKATVTVEHKDVVVEDPTLETEDSQGYEDNAIALGIDAGLSDTDGSETLSVTISGVPEGASLSAGTDNGDGTWTLEEGDLDGLSITPPADSDADFQLSVSATSTESNTGESRTVNTTLDVKVDAVADDTTVGGSAETEGVGGGDHAVTVNLNATFGDYEDGSESHFVLVEVPDGWGAPEGAEVVNGGDFDGLPDKQFVKVEVDNADLADSGGSAQVSVTFQVPDDQQSGDINFDVFSGAAETPSDGGEITLDNNTSFSGTQVTASYENGAPTVDAGEVRLDENNLGGGTASATGDIDIDFGADGEGAVTMSVPTELEDMGLTSGGDAITFTVSEDGQSIIGSTPDGSPVMTITLNEDGGDYSYTVEMRAPLDHDGASGELIDDMPVTLTVTDGNGESTEATLNIDIADANPGAVDDRMVTLEEGGSTVGSGNGGDNLLANDDVGADGGEITSFTYTDEAGNAQTADAGSTVDTEHGSLTVNADGSWSFTSDESADHGDGETVSDGFTYTITDGDGDTATATQDITITDEGPKIGPPPGTGGGEPGADGYSVTLDEGDLGAGAATAGGQALNIDFGADGEGAVALSVPQELEDMGLTAGGEAVTFTVSDDGQSITGSTPDGSPVMTITLNEDGGNYSYSVELSDNLDHTGANGETISDIPVTLTVTDGDGDTASTSLNVNVVDDAPAAVDDGTFNVTDGGNTIGTDGGQDNLLANDDPGADGAQVTSFTYTDENGENQTAQAGSTVDTEQGTLTVNADGTWSFESDEQMESADGQPVMDNFTYTITDGDGDTATANVTINVSDGTAQPPELVVGDAEGYEDNAIPLNIDASLTDTDGSERLSVTISGVPNGASLSAGTDNGDGTWSLEEGDLDGLTVTPPTDSDVDFDLSVSVTSTETATGETTTVTDTFTVEVNAVADPTTVSATVGTTLVEGDPAPETGDITVTNSGHEEAGFHNTYGYYIKDEDGNPTEGKIIFADTKDNIGDSYTIEDVDPDRVGFFVLPNGDNVNDGLSNGMDVTFEQDGNGTWHVVNAETGETLEGDGSYQQGGVQDSLFFSDNNLNADGMDHVEDTGTVGNQNWEDLMKTATGQDNDYDDVNMQVDFKPDAGDSTEPHCEVSVNVDATFGDFTDGSEGHYVFVEVPEGWTPTGEGVETVNNGDHPQLPEGGNFVKVPVSQEQLEAGDGAVTVNVTFEAPVSEAGEDVRIDVFAGAIEENLDGGELTTDNNTSFSNSSVTVEGKDLTVEPPELAADDAQGYEDTAIPLNIDAGLSDTDGSESLSVTISGVPEGASLSAGTDNGDGTWALEEGDLNGLTITPPADSDVDFDLTVTATSTEASTGETSTVESSFTVEVDAVADDVGVSAEIKATIVPGENDGAEPETVTIGADNYDAGDADFTVSGRTLDRHGNLSEGSSDNISVKSSGHPTGFGVKGDASNGADSEIGYEDGKSEQVVVDIDSDVSEANVTIAWQNPNEDCRITLYRDGEPVGERVIEGGTDGVDSLGTFQADDGGSFDQIVFEATGENSDFLVHEISFEVAPPEPAPVCEVEIDVTATFGDFEDGSEQHFVFVEVPEGMTPADENAQTVEGNAENGLTEGQTFVIVEVDAADIEAGGGTVTVPVSFTGPVPEDGGGVTANVFAGARETNLDGGELTFDNNLKLAGTSVESEKGDMTVSDPEMNVDDAAGLEDTAIPLDFNIGLTDTDGSESMAITVSDVPGGATLSAGTDNGDGTWTLEESDLDGLTITPPHNSDVDFDLKVDVAVTESATGETKTFSEDVKVEVTADADAPTLDASLSASDDDDSGNVGQGSNANNGFGNGDQTAPGNSNDHNNAENAGGDGTSANNDFVDDGGQNHHGTGGDDNFIVDRDLNMNENFNMGGGDDTVTVNGDTSQGHNFNMGAGDDNLALNGDINGNTAMDGGSGNDVLYLEGDSDQYTLQNFTDNQGHINTQIIDNDTGQTITVNNVEAISFGDGEVVGNADLVDRDTGGDTEAEPTVYDLDIDSALTDLDGSESLTVTLGPVPEGVTFSAGTDNGDGTWSLASDELQDLQMTVEAGVKEDFDLPIKATSTEAENGDAESVNMSLKIELPEDHGTPVDPPVDNDGGTGHGSGQGTGAGKSGSGHGTGGASKVAKSGSGHGNGKSGSGQGKSGSGHGRGGASKVAGSGSGEGRGRSGSGHGRGGHSDAGRGRGGSGSGHGRDRGSEQGRGRGGSGSGHGRGGHSGKGHSRGGSGHGHSGHGKSGSGQGSGQGIAAAGGGSGHGGPQGNNGFGNGDQDAPGNSGGNNNAENAGGDDGDRLMNALNKFANADPAADDGGGDTFRNVGAGRGENGDDGNWFDEQQQAPADDDVFGKTELEQKEEDDQKAEEAQREEEEGGIQIPVEDNSGNEADFEDRSLV
ncbi:MAG: DUF5801 repeats-in-toxin domain-containing protein [Rhodospirillales bacterium]